MADSRDFAPEDEDLRGVGRVMRPAVPSAWDAIHARDENWWTRARLEKIRERLNRGAQLAALAAELGVMPAMLGYRLKQFKDFSDCRPR